MVTAPDAFEIHTCIEISLEHLIFQAVLHGFWSRRNFNCVDNKFLDLIKDILYQEDQVSYVNPQSWISHFGFYHRVQWRGVKTAGQECWVCCHGLIPSLWDFAQNCSLQIER